MKYPFNKGIIESLPIECENDLAEVIIELRKAVKYLLDSNVELEATVRRQGYELRRFSSMEEAARDMDRKLGSPTMKLPPPIPTIGTPWEALTSSAPSSMKTASDVKKQIEAMERAARGKFDMVVHPPLIKSDTEYVD